MRAHWVAVLLLLCPLFAGCGGDPERAETPASEPETFNTVVADNLGEQSPDKYALGKSGGEREGCSEAPPGAGAGVPGCVYAAAFAGCTKGLTGDDPSPIPFAREFPEQELRAIYREAISDCKKGALEGDASDGTTPPARRLPTRTVLRDKVGDAGPRWDITEIAVRGKRQGLEIDVIYRGNPRPKSKSNGLLVGIEIDVRTASQDLSIDLLRDSAHYPDRLELVGAKDYKPVRCRGLGLESHDREGQLTFTIPRHCLGAGVDSARVQGYNYLPRGAAFQADYVDPWSSPVALG